MQYYNKQPAKKMSQTPCHNTIYYTPRRCLGFVRDTLCLLLSSFRRLKSTQNLESITICTFVKYIYTLCAKMCLSSLNLDHFYVCSFLEKREEKKVFYTSFDVLKKTLNLKLTSFQRDVY